VYVHHSKNSLPKHSSIKPNPTKRQTPPAQSTRKVVGYESDDSNQDNPYQTPHSGVQGGGTFKRTQLDPASQPSIDNKLNYES